MDLQQDIQSLIKACAAYLRDDGYSEARISDYQGFWQNGVAKYMETHSIANYSADVGERFIKNYHSCPTKNSTNSPITFM